MQQFGNRKLSPLGRFSAQAFTLVELIATVAILALIVTAALMFVGNYIQSAKYESDHQTLTVLNDALTRYKTQGGDLTALTAETPIDNVISALQSPVSWAGMNHQFLKTGDSYLAASIDATGNGAQYRFTRYDTYGEVVATDGAQSQSYGGYAAWETDALAAVPSGNSLTITNPSSTNTIQLDVRVANQGDQVWVWWDDGTTSEMYEPNTQSNTVISHTYGSSANRTIVIYGDITRLESDYSDGRSNFAFDISTIPNTLAHIVVWGSNTISGSVAALTWLDYLVVGGSNTLSGSVAGLTGLTTLYVNGSNTLSGSVAGLTSLTTLNVNGTNTLSGSVAALTSLERLVAQGSNTISGSITGLTNLNFVGIWGNTALSGDISGLTNLTSFSVGGTNTITGSLTGLTSCNTFALSGNNAISGDVTGMDLIYLGLWGNSTVSGDISGMTNLQLLALWGNSAIDTASIVTATGTAGGISIIELSSNYTINQTQMDTILANFWANRDVAKPRNSERKIDIEEASHSAPSASGNTTKANLQAYMSPNNTGPMVWTVLTN